ncbi:MAG: alpha/beta hydrolase [Burkholderiaceae bacterium]
MKMVLVHGAAHHGGHFGSVAALLRHQGNQVWCPTVKGNRPGDDAARVGLDEAIDSIVTFFDDENIDDAVLLGHSWGGMIITGVADRLAPGRIRRLVYYSAFVPNDGESLIDMVPPHYKAMFDEMGANGGTVFFPPPVFREAFMNDASKQVSDAHYATLVPHPYATMNDKIKLSRNPAEFEIGKSYLHCSEDVALPASMPWHPRLSEKLGLYRLVSMPGSHSTFVTNPQVLAQKIIEAGRD